MIGTLSMLALVALGYSHFNLLVVLPFAIINALVGLSQQREPAEGADPEPDFFPSLFRVLPMQILLTSLGYGMGFGASLILA